LGIQSLELKWFESYLSDRKQFVQKWYGFWPVLTPLAGGRRRKEGGLLQLL
jgi:hypothetical protein